MKNFIKLSLYTFLICFLCFGILVSWGKKNASRKLILINKFVSHPALDETSHGIVDALGKAGFMRNKNADIRIESAQANPTLASQISNKFVAQNPDIVICIGTISAQSMVKHTNDGVAKMVFSSITDPLGAGLVKDLDSPEKNITGVSNFVKLEPQLTIMKKFQPKLKKLGILYNAGEVNSVSIVEKLTAIADQFDLHIVKQAVTGTSTVTQAAVKLAYEVDAIFVSNDNTALSCLPSIVHVCNSANIPLYVSDTDAVKFGALAAFGPNQYDIGIQTGKMVAKILKGESIANIPVEFPQNMELYINANVAKFLGIELPQEILSSATKIININQ
ncbi:MAG: ABC transporter substrate-binding protein [Puniceicoccales bacterium]|jgi:putative ABC transport system substrate-binding protein|nr:ABC transporter substrate-binding protein [Puniceicoccales bacterium]